MTAPLSDAEFFELCARRSRERVPFALCSVVRTEGPAPRDAGARMVVYEDGTFAGTVGGGPLEAMVLQKAVELLATRGASEKIEFALTTEGEVSIGMKCGGSVEVFVDVVRPPPRVVIYGGGHVSERVSAVAGDAGLPHVVLDDRAEFARRERFPRAEEVRLADLRADPAGGIVAGPEDFVVIVTRCHAIDETVLEAAVRGRARYIGLIGSRRKIGVIMKSLRQRGLDLRADPRVYAPIGLDLGDKSPGEIAVSVVAEILQLKSGRRGGHKRIGPRAAASREREASESEQAEPVATARAPDGTER
jgi:xanthine dehydrogenase accessory factor